MAPYEPPAGSSPAFGLFPIVPGVLWPNAGFSGRLDVICRTNRLCASCHALHRHRQLSPRGWSPSTWRTREDAARATGCALTNGSCARAAAAVLHTWRHHLALQAALSAVALFHKPLKIALKLMLDV